MAFSIWEKLEQVRQEPEHIRMRYVFGCLAVSMVFVVAIWFLSVRSGFHSATRSFPSTELDQKGNPLERQPSLEDMLKQASPLRVEDTQKTTGAQFFEDQVRAKSETSQEGIPNTQER